jgi:hypothetical protein
MPYRYAVTATAQIALRGTSRYERSPLPCFKQRDTRDNSGYAHAVIRGLSRRRQRRTTTLSACLCAGRRAENVRFCRGQGRMLRYETLACHVAVSSG